MVIALTHMMKYNDKKLAENVECVFRIVCENLKLVGGKMHRCTRVRTATVGCKKRFVDVLSRILFASEKAHVLAKVCWKRE